ncbi:50S ribosomal protein L16 [Candidatus Woesearchaeota archaeon]|nr:50S ribosomal protein L16 [Candidatus Woesearchaeota archaeon]
MAGLRPFSCYRRLKRAYTRKSKYNKLSFVKAVPSSKIVKFDMGSTEKKFERQVKLVSRVGIQIRHNALESARVITLRRLEINLGKNFFFKVRTYPHHVLRENKMLSGAGADRMQQGMQKAFGRAVGIAAQVRKGQAIFSVDVEPANVAIAKEALKAATYRLPCKCLIVESKK